MTTSYSYDIIAGTRSQPRGVLAYGLSLAEANKAKADYSLGRGCPRYVKRIAQPVAAANYRRDCPCGRRVAVRPI